ncbi:MAG TPA: putative toxin-antitoxin system toxin component, PIN family [Lachnospiraceae bacterium]|nr:putative toxin-antitoxin system toxin component, PIN family [Lachnospiraceae bacterium]
MRIMVDTNVLISLLVFSSKKMNQMMECIFMEHQLVLSSYIVEELKDVVRRKFPEKVGIVDALLAKMNYEYVYTPDILDETLFEIRDVKDYPVLYTAILEDVDILVTGDSDFDDVDFEKPEILTPAKFVERYVEI